MLLHVTHETRYDYTPPVETAQHLAHLKPRDHASQRLLSHRCTITPTPAQRSEATDVYGNTRAFFALRGHARRTGRARPRAWSRPSRRADDAAAREPALGSGARALPLPQGRALTTRPRIRLSLALRAAPRRLRGLRARPASRRSGRCSTRRMDLMLRIHARLRLRHRQHRDQHAGASRRWPSARACARTSPTS